MKKSLIAAAFACSAMLGTAAAAQQTETPVALAPVVVPNKSFWDNLSLTVSGLSAHIGKHSFVDSDSVSKHYREFNPGIGIEYRLSEHFQIGAGTYENSQLARTWYAMGGWEPDSRSFLGGGIKAGLATGYNLPVVPAVLPYIRVGSARNLFNANVGLMMSWPVAVAAQLRINPF
jgi:opacity protein-like surface antigen